MEQKLTEFMASITDRLDALTDYVSEEIAEMQEALDTRRDVTVVNLNYTAKSAGDLADAYAAVLEVGEEFDEDDDDLGLFNFDETDALSAIEEIYADLEEGGIEKEVSEEASPLEDESEDLWDESPSISWSDYIAFIRTTAIYPPGMAGLVYEGLGLTSEVGELAGLFKKIIRDRAPGSNLTQEDYLKAQKELGDVLWYTARLADGMTDASASDNEIFNALVELGLEEILKVPSEYAIQYLIFKLSQSAGAISNVLALVMNNESEDRPPADELPPFIVGSVDAQLKLIIIHSVALAGFLKVNIYDILLINKAKLESRLERNKIGGSGDDR